ncbi:unnamed protein product [Ascophyllum nodosum]
MQLSAIEASAGREIATLRAQNESMLASLAQATAAVKNMAEEGSALEIRLNHVEAQSRRENVQYDAVYTMSRAKVDFSIFPLGQWVAGIAHEVKADLDLDQLANQLVMGRNDSAILDGVVKNVETEVLNRVRSAPIPQQQDMWHFLDFLPAPPQMASSAPALSAAVVPPSPVAPATALPPAPPVAPTTALPPAPPIAPATALLPAPPASRAKRAFQASAPPTSPPVPSVSPPVPQYLPPRSRRRTA